MTDADQPQAQPAVFDMDGVLADLVSGEDEAPHWLQPSFAEPRRFIEGLYERFRQSQTTSVRSRAHLRYDFYQDMVLRHTEQGKVAMVSYVSGAALELSYDELHQRSSRLVTAWLDAGVVAGTALCIALPFGDDYLVALMTALRLGAVITLVGQPNTLLAQHQIAWSGAAMVVAEATEAERMPEGIVLLPVRARLAALSETQLFAYPTETPCMQLLSAFPAGGQDPQALHEVMADAVYTGALRDALLAFGLRATDRVAAPGFAVVQYQPQLLLMTLLAGASYLHIPVSVLKESSHVRDSAAPTVLGIAPVVRDHPKWLTHTFVAKLRLWFRSLTERLDLHRWEALDKRFEERSLRSLSIASNAAFGGCFAFSKRRVKQLALALFPAPGEPWMLEETNRSGLPALGAAGILSHPADPDRQAVGQFIFSRSRQRYSIGASIEFARSGRAVYQQLYESVVLELPEVEQVSLILAASGAPNDSSLLLICFVDPLRSGGAEGELTSSVVKRLTAAIEERLTATFGVGAELVPDRIAIYTIRPKLTPEGALDSRWCRDQYLSGTLARKQAHPTFRALSQLGKAMQLMQEA